MDRKYKDKNDSAEIRSEKVRNILGEIPPIFSKLAVAIIIVLFTLLLIASIFYLRN